MLRSWARAGAIAALLTLPTIVPAGASPESEALAREGLRQLQTGEQEAAVRSLIDATNADPQDGRAFFYLGVALNRFGQPYPALTALRRAATLGAIHRDLRFEAGWAALETGRYTAAADFLETFVESQPDNAKAHEFLGRAYIPLGRLDEAERELRRAIELDPGLEPSSTLFLAEIATKRGNPETAASEFNRIQRLAPDSPIGRTLLDIRREVSPPVPAKPWTAFAQTYVGSNSNVIALSDTIVRPADITNTKSNYFGIVAGGRYKLKLDSENAVLAGGTLGHQNFREIGGQDTHTASAFGTYERIITPRIRALGTASYSHSRVDGDAFLNAFTLNPAVQVRVNSRMQVELGYSATRLNYPEPSVTPANLDRDSTLQSYGGRVIIAFPSLDSELEVGAQRLHNAADGSDFDYRATAFSLGVRTQLPWDLESSVRVQRTKYDYANLNSLAPTTPPGPTAFGFARDDSVTLMSFRLLRPIFDNVSAYVQYSHTRANSNLAVFTYKQNDTQAGIIARF